MTKTLDILHPQIFILMYSGTESKEKTYCSKILKQSTANGLQGNALKKHSSTMSEYYISVWKRRYSEKVLLKYF